MKRINSLVCTAAIILISGIAVSDVCAQSTGGRALFSYPMTRANAGAARSRSRRLP